MGVMLAAPLWAAQQACKLPVFGPAPRNRRRGCKFKGFPGAFDLSGNSRPLRHHFALTNR